MVNWNGPKTTVITQVVSTNSLDYLKEIGVLSTMNAGVLLRSIVIPPMAQSKLMMDTSWLAEQALKDARPSVFRLHGLGLNANLIQEKSGDLLLSLLTLREKEFTVEWTISKTQNR